MPVKRRTSNFCSGLSADLKRSGLGCPLCRGNRTSIVDLLNSTAARSAFRRRADAEARQLQCLLIARTGHSSPMRGECPDCAVGLTYRASLDCHQQLIRVAAMTAAHPVAFRSPDRTGVCCPGRIAPSHGEMVTGPGCSSPNQPDKERTTAYCASAGPDSWADAH